eukprot:15450435-Alexandrium_andersonii.AAC.1
MPRQPREVLAQRLQPPLLENHQMLVDWGLPRNRRTILQIQLVGGNARGVTHELQVIRQPGAHEHNRRHTHAHTHSDNGQTMIIRIVQQVHAVGLAR